MKMQSALLLVLACVLGFSLATNQCNFVQLHKQLKNREMTLASYTRQYMQCITRSADSPPMNGYQPSCEDEQPVTQAIAKFQNSGTFPATDGNTYPFNIKAVVTLTQLDKYNTRIHATVSGLHHFLADSNYDLFHLHVHELGETSPDCMATSGHYNPCGKNHSNDATVEDRHVGDLAVVSIPSNFTSDSDILTIDIIDTQVKLTGSLSVLGRSITVHGGFEETRIGCGTIAVTQWDGEYHPDSTYSLNNSFWN